MSKQKHVVLIGEQEYPCEGVNVNVPLSVIYQLTQELQQAAQKECVTLLRPFVTSSIGRERIMTIEEKYLVDEEVVSEPEAVFTDMASNQRIPNVDFKNIIQTIRRPY